MECERCLEQLSARLDGDLTDRETQELERHLAQCPDCRALADQLKQLQTDFAQLAEKEAPPGFAQGVMEQIRREKRVIPLFRRPQFKALAGLAACAAICIGIYGAGLLDGPETPGSGAVLQSSDQSDTSISAYALPPENTEESRGEIAQRDALSPAGSASDSTAGPAGDPAADGPSLQIQAAAAPAPSLVLTVDAMPAGAAELLSDETTVSHSAQDGRDTYAPLTREQLDEIERLAQEQGITASRTSQEGAEGLCALVVLAG